MLICNVANCRYTQTGKVEDFPVCELHDCKHVQAIIENFQRPGHFWMQDRPIVLPVGELAIEHFTPLPGNGASVDDCPILEAADFDCQSIVLPRYDLLKEWQA